MTATNLAEKGRLERTAPLLKQSQIEDLQSERDRLSSQLNAPPHLRRAIQDPALMMKTLKGIERSLNEDAPVAYQGPELDKALKRAKELRDLIQADMCTQAEMRRNPPGALDKHIAFESKHEGNILEYKNIQKRLLAAGALPSGMSERSAANIEMFRPAGGPGEMNMDNAQIPVTRTISLGANRSSTLNEREIEIIKLLAPDIYEKLALLSSEQRDDLKAAIGDAPLDIDALKMNELQERCRALGFESGGSKDELRTRLKEHYGKG